MSTWNREAVEQHSIYGARNSHNPLYVIWRTLRESGEPICRDWRRSYAAFATDTLQELGEPTGTSIRRRSPCTDYRRNNVEWSTMSYQPTQSPRYGRRPKEGVSNRPSSFNSKRADGLLLIAGRTFKNQYQYKKYWQRRNYIKPDGRPLIEGVDFYLHRDGYVVDEVDANNERQL